MKTIEQVKAMVAVLTEEQQQLLKDTIVYGTWGDTTETFINEEGERIESYCYGYITNDAKMAGNFSGRKVSAMFRSIYNKVCKDLHTGYGYGEVISHCTDWWGDGTGDVLFIHTDWVDAFEAWARGKELVASTQVQATEEQPERVSTLELDIHKEGVNAHNPKRYYYGVDRLTKQVVFTCSTEEEARELAVKHGYQLKNTCWNF